MRITAHPVGPARAALLLAQRDCRARFLSLWPYLLASVACAIAAFFLSAFDATFVTESVAVSADPLAVVHAAVLAFLALVLGIHAATALSWEREHRTLEVLFSGPVTPTAIVGAKLLAELAVLVAIGLVYSAYLALVRPLGSGLSVSGAFWRLSPLVLPMIALGLVVGAAASTVRAGVITFLALALCLSAVEIVALWLDAQDPNGLSLAALYSRRVLATVVGWISPVSPAAYLADLAKAAGGLGLPSPERLLAALAVSVALLLGAASVTRVRGGV